MTEPKHSPELRAEVLAAYDNRGDKTPTEIAEQFGLQVNTIKAWLMTRSKTKPVDDSNSPIDLFRAAALAGILASDLTTRQPDKVASQAESYAQEMMRAREEA